MPDKYNFSKHLSQGLKPVLNQLGFKKNGLKFIREIEDSKYVIEISRSSWNATEGPNELSIHLRFVTAFLDSTTLLHRPTKMRFPSHYAPFFQDKLDWSDKSKLMQSFTDEENEEIRNYHDSISWKYHNEEDLIILFHEIKEQIIVVGIPTLYEVEELVDKGLNSFSFSKEMRKCSNRLYLNQLNIESRFPED